MALDDRTLDTILHRGVAEIIVEEEFVALMKKGDKLRLKMGFDPSSTDIHLGHAVGLRKLRQLQELGHTVVLIVGDWTARIGDPSGQSAIRRMLTAEEVYQNAETYMAQFFKIVDKSKTEIAWQSEWFGEFDLEQVIRLKLRNHGASVGESVRRAHAYPRHHERVHKRTPAGTLETCSTNRVHEDRSGQDWRRHRSRRQDDP